MRAWLLGMRTLKDHFGVCCVCTACTMSEKTSSEFESALSSLLAHSTVFVMRVMESFFVWRALICTIRKCVVPLCRVHGCSLHIRAIHVESVYGHIHHACNMIFIHVQRLFNLLCTCSFVMKREWHFPFLVLFCRGFSFPHPLTCMSQASHKLCLHLGP